MKKWILACALFSLVSLAESTPPTDNALPAARAIEPSRQGEVQMVPPTEEAAPKEGVAPDAGKETEGRRVESEAPAGSEPKSDRNAYSE